MQKCDFRKKNSVHNNKKLQILYLLSEEQFYLKNIINEMQIENQIIKCVSKEN